MRMVVAVPCRVTNECIQTLVWHNEAQTDLMAEIGALAGLTVTIAGTPEKGRAVAPAWGEGVSETDDLRAALASSADIRLAIIADPGGFGEDSADAAAVGGFIQRGGRVMSFEPLPPTVHAVSSGWGASFDGTPLHATVGFAGSATATPAIREAIEALAHFGPITAFAINCTAGPDIGSLGARLYSAMEMVYLFAGEPESISAVLAQPREARTGKVARLRELRGTMTASIRFADARAATILVSASAEPWHRGITILGDGGRMRVWDDGFIWTAPDGSVVDEYRSSSTSAPTQSSARTSGKKPPRELSHLNLFAQVQADQTVVAGRPAAQHIASAVSHMFASQTPRMHALAVLAMAETALLSARTGSAESPQTLQRIAESI